MRTYGHRTFGTRVQPFKKFQLFFKDNFPDEIKKLQKILQDASKALPKSAKTSKTDKKSSGKEAPKGDKKGSKRPQETKMPEFNNTGV